jgi:hypothetical protein
MGLEFAVLAALLAAASFLPRRYPVLEVARLRQNYLTASVEETKLELLDTEILMVEQEAALVNQKGRGVRASVVASRSARESDSVHRGPASDLAGDSLEVPEPFARAAGEIFATARNAESERPRDRGP